ncbi:MAG: hypothetical protein GY754_10775 [bacterium]|nr:hypothetical protein [bacterium]
MTEELKPLGNDPEAPDSEETLPVQEEKAKAPKVVGIVLIVFSSMYALYGFIVGLIVFGALYAMNAFGDGRIGDVRTLPFNFLSGIASREFSGIMIARAFLYILAGVISIAALVAGIGLVRYKEKMGRKLSIVWGGIALGFLVIEFLIMTFMMKAVLSSLSSETVSMDSMVSNPASSIWEIFLQLVMAVLPIVTIVLMTRPSAKNSCE